LIASLPLTVTAIQLRFTSIVQWLFLPALVFEAAWNLQLGTLRRVWPAVALLAPGGVFATAFVVGAGLALAKVHKDALEQAHAATVGRCRETLVKRR
jgi:NhaP-type Na+/H+ or K+/H+ antiporter